ncbi:MAG: hypothetical protein K2I10_14010, partial [Lachnospiraceae bacterium]|nr:hypothetical protein [Lachnospiraceae bacterium]
MHNLQFCFDEFLKKLKDIENYIESIDLQKKIIRELSSISQEDNLELNNSFQYIEKIKKVIVSPVQYNALIISLYGCYENYIDNIFKKYIEILCASVSSYDKLPAKLKEKHIKKLGDYLINPQRYKNYELTPELAIKNGYGFTSDIEEINLGNLKLMLSHGGNLGIDQIIELMRDVGIDNASQKICNNVLFRKFHFENRELSESIYKRWAAHEYKKLFTTLDDFVQERNNVAHGWVENRTQYSEVKNVLINFLKIFSEVIKEILIEELLSLRFLSGGMVKWDSPQKIIDNHILCVNCETNEVHIG